MYDIYLSPVDRALAYLMLLTDFWLFPLLLSFFIYHCQSFDLVPLHPCLRICLMQQQETDESTWTPCCVRCPCESETQRRLRLAKCVFGVRGTILTAVPTDGHTTGTTFCCVSNGEKENEKANLGDFFSFLEREKQPHCLTQDAYSVVNKPHNYCHDRLPFFLSTILKRVLFQQMYDVSSSQVHTGVLAE